MKNNSYLKFFLYSLPALIIAGVLVAKFSDLGLIGIIGIIIIIALFSLILKNPLIGLAFIVFTLPFERIPTYDIGLFTLKINQIFAGLTIVACAAKMLIDKVKIKPYAIGWPIIFYLLVSFVSIFYAGDFSRAVSVFVFVAFMIIVSFATVQILDSRDKLKIIIKWLFIITTLVCLFGIYQFLADVVGFPIELTGLKDIYTKSVLGFPRIHAFSMEPLYFANFLFVPLGVAASLYFYKIKETISSPKLIFLITLILINIILGISRGAYIALGAMIVFFVVFLARKVFVLKNVATTIIILLLVLGGTYLFVKNSRPDALEKFIGHAKVEDFSEGESVQKRLGDFEQAIEFWKEKPWIGIGPGNYGPRYEGYPSHDEVTDWEIVNNQYIETLAETGILGLIFFSIIIIILLWRSVLAFGKCQDKYTKSVLVGLTASFAAVLVQYNFFSTLYIMHIWVLIGLLIAVQNMAFKKNKELTEEEALKIITEGEKEYKEGKTKILASFKDLR